MKSGRFLSQYLFLIFLVGALSSPGWTGPLPEGFVYLEEITQDISTELHYFTNDNFVGERIDGYFASRCILTKAAAEALKKVQDV